MHPISLQRVMNGYVVTVGCMYFVFNSFDEMITELQAYHDHTEETTKKWLGVQEKLNLPSQPPTACEPDRPRPDRAYVGESPGRLRRADEEASIAMPMSGGAVTGGIR
jgi:hypothetical protein